MPPWTGAPRLLHRRPGRSTWPSLRQLGEFAPDGGDITFLAGDAGLHVGHSVDVLLIISLVAKSLGLALVVVFLHLRQALFLALEFGFEDAAGVAVAVALVIGVDTLVSGTRGGRRCRRTGARFGGLNDGDWGAFEGAAALVTRLLGGQRVGVEHRVPRAAIDLAARWLLLRRGERCQHRSDHQREREPTQSFDCNTFHSPTPVEKQRERLHSR